jgi:nitroreductase
MLNELLNELTEAENKALCREIIRRRSVRNYTGEPLPLGFRERFKEFCLKKAEDLEVSEEINSSITFQLLSADQVEKPFNKAPSYLCAYCGKNGQLNAAYKMEQASLWLSSEEIGSCWLGMAKPKKEFMEANDMPFYKMLALGAAPNPLQIYRSDLSNFQRKALSEIYHKEANVNDSYASILDTLEALRLAPSAVNSQLWRIQGAQLDEKTLALRLYMLRSPFGLLEGQKLADAGIALCHLILCARKNGIYKELIREETPPPLAKAQSLAKAQYIRSLIVEV